MKDRFVRACFGLTQNQYEHSALNSGCGRKKMILSLGLNDFVDKPVCKSFVGGHIVVALGVKFNAGNGLAGARGKYSIQLFANAQDLFGMNLNIRCLPLCAAGG